jgi:hypothetical protein
MKKMTSISNKFKHIFLILVFCFFATMAWNQELNLRISGDDEQGFLVDIYDGDQLLIQNTEEFSLRVANLDMSEIVEIPAWKGSAWTGDENRVSLSQETYLPELDLNLSISVTYEVINQHVIRKSVDLFQSGMPSLYCTIGQTAKPAETPLKYVTFEYDDFPGGFVHEIFPSAGFVTPGNQVRRVYNGCRL